MTRPVLLTLGHGYSAAALAASLGPGWRRLGTTRSRERAAADARGRGRAGGLGGRRPRWTPRSPRASHVLVSMPPDADGDPRCARTRAALAARGPEWVGYLSTTGVYGDRGGGWVDESMRSRPVQRRAAAGACGPRRLARRGLPVEIFRLAGIYGPGRSAFDRLREGRAQRIVKAGQFFSRIHVEDIARVRCAPRSRDPHPGAVWNVADDEPAPPQDVIAYAAGLLACRRRRRSPSRPPRCRRWPAASTPRSKRVSNARLRERLGCALRYPNYRVGLRAILAGGG